MKMRALFCVLLWITVVFGLTLQPRFCFADTCSACGGSGKVACPGCGGSGISGYVNVGGATGAYGCEQCGGIRGNPAQGTGSQGTGTIPCPACRGTGQVESQQSYSEQPSSYDDNANGQKALEEQQKKEQEDARLRQEEFEKNKQEVLKNMKGITENELGLKGIGTASDTGLKGVGEAGSGDLGLKTLFEKPSGNPPPVDTRVKGPSRLDIEKERVRLVREDTKSYRSQLQKLMSETDHMKVPRPTVLDHIHEGIMLGLLSPGESDLFGAQSPFSGKKYREGEVFATTNVKDASEVIRGVLDNHHMGEYTLNTPYGKELIEKLNGKQFDRLVAHSNGATIAEALIRKGVISVDELNIVGGDRSMINKWGLQELIDSGKVKRIVVWINPGDIIPPGSSCVLPTPFKETGSIPLASTAAYFARRLTTWNKPGSEVDYHILKGSQYKGQEVHLDKTFFDAHNLKDAYLYNIKKYFDSKGN